MLTENEARDLLRRAGETIDVDASAPVSIRSTPRRPWLFAAAAAAVAAVLLAVFALADGPNGRDTKDQQGPTTWPTEVPNAYELDDDQVPLLFGFTVESARSELEDRGFVVQVNHKESCDLPDRVTATDPEVGTHVKPGATVTVVTARSPANMRCDTADQQLAWSLIDFASGRGPAPEFADEVDYYLGDLEHVTLSRKAAETRGSWDLCPAGLPTACPLSPMRELLASQFAMVNNRPQMPYLQISRGPSTTGCINDRQMLDAREGLQVAITIPTDGRSLCANTVGVFSHDGVIDAIVLGTYFEKDQLPYSTDVQPLIGLTEDEARARIEAYGQRMKVIPAEDAGLCIASAPPVVADQEPGATTSIKAGDVVTVRMRWILCGEVPTMKLAGAFVAFARGLTDHAPWAPEVRVYLGNEYQKTLTTEQADDRSAWDLCTEYAGRSCPISAVRVLAAHPGEPSYRTFIARGCHPEELTEAPKPGGIGFVVAGEGEPRTCSEDFQAQIWGNGSRIIAVNLLLGAS